MCVRMSVCTRYVGCICGCMRACTSSVDIHPSAQLRTEPDNVYDPNAVVVLERAPTGKGAVEGEGNLTPTTTTSNGDDHGDDHDASSGGEALDVFGLRALGHLPRRVACHISPLLEADLARIIAVVAPLAPHATTDGAGETEEEEDNNIAAASTTLAVTITVTMHRPSTVHHPTGNI